jgi:hypothetical protein
MKRKTKSRQTRLKTKLGLPDLEHAKVAVIVSLRSFESQRSYRHSIDEFVAWYCSLRDYRSTKLFPPLSASPRRSASGCGDHKRQASGIRRLAYEAVDSDY